MKTSEHLATAATQLATLLRHGQDDLTTEHDLTLAVHARDQAVTALAQTLRTVVARLDTLGGHQDAVHAVTMLIPGLTPTNVDLPVPAHLATHAPASRTGTAWADAATAIEAAAEQARRAGPATGPELRAAAADLTALTSSLPALDADLTTALTTGGLHQAARTLTRPDLQASERLQQHLRTARSVLDSGGLPDRYHLRPPALGVVPVPAAHLLPAAVQRATALADSGPALTAAQHAAVAMETARLANHLRRHLSADPTLAASSPMVDAALHRFTHAQLGLAHVWSTTSSLWYSRPGSWDVPAQLQAINRFLAGPPDAVTARVVQDTVALLPPLAATVAAGFDQALTRQEWLAAYQDDAGRTAWATLWPDYGPVARGLTPAVSDIAPVDVHLVGHAIHETWHDRGLPVEGYRLGDPIEDRRVGSPRGVAELTRVYVAAEAVTATGRGLQNAVGAGRTTAHAATARGILPPSLATLPDRPALASAPVPAVMTIRHAADLPEGLYRVSVLLQATDHLSPTQLRLIARATGETAVITAQALERAGHHASATALTEHARLLTQAIRRASAAAPTTRGEAHPVAQAEQVRHRVAALRRNGNRLDGVQALAVAQVIPVVTEALADATHRAISSAPRHEATAPATAPARRPTDPADVLARLTAAAIRTTELRTVLATEYPTCYRIETFAPGLVA